MGIIGTGNQGIGDMRQFLKDERVQVVAVCDVNRESGGYWNGAWRTRTRPPPGGEAYAEQKASGTYKGCDAYVDFRELLARKDIDAVEIATPDHWHAIPVIEACKAGKDIYCQKPLSLTIAEGRAMSNAVKKYRRVFQTGSQQRSDPHFRRACELVRNGRIGKLHTVRCGLPGGRPDLGKTGEHKSARTGAGRLRLCDLARPRARSAVCARPLPCEFPLDLRLFRRAGHGLGRASSRLRAVGHGNRLHRAGRNPQGRSACSRPIELWNTATEFYFEAVYENGVTMIISDKERSGVTWEGAEGWVWADRGKHDASSKAILNSEIGPDEIHLYKSDNHFRNFIDCVIHRKECVAPAEVAHRSITICHWATSPCGWAANAEMGPGHGADHRRRRKPRRCCTAPTITAGNWKTAIHEA